MIKKFLKSISEAKEQILINTRNCRIQQDEFSNSLKCLCEYQYLGWRYCRKFISEYRLF